MSADSLAHAVQHPGEKVRVAPVSASMGVRALLGLMIVIGVVTFLLEVKTDPTRAYAAWLHNYWVFLCLGLSGTFFTAIHYLVGATWSVAVRRIADAFSSFVPVAVLLFLVVVIGIPHIYIWSSPAATQGEEWKLIAKGGYLSPNLFVLRNLSFLALWVFFSWFFVRNSTKQDETRDLSLSKANLKYAPIFVLTFALTFTLASFDMLMSLEPTWYSTIFGVYCWAGLWQSGLAAIAITAVLLRRQGALQGVVSRAHYHDLGKNIFAYSVFWTYIAFSQLMLIWYANLPEEIEWMIHRIYTGWGAIAIVVGVLKFVIPFFVLMPQKVKENEIALLTVASAVVIGQWLDMYWVIYPAFSPEHAVLSWNEVGVAVGFIGLFGWTVQWFLSRHPAAPHGDPYFQASVRFHA
ncbi:MAG: hypothetical protein E6K76_02885 [Candidatus Eisenbacteria bacterium]|uniref:Molybdopterin oxidoreductase n=1 Tax=Eiseniibacteriota bacterium TaxID=2212470 RepID=A0A538T8Y4_UNCEI|nr:MAG: hypothetical protein E6K76_02885 [Candidatus Eisenbacteria bacterium]